MKYPEEVALKNEALGAFWRHHRLPGRPDPVAGSPRPRGYRTTSKRRVAVVGGQVHLFLGDRTPRRDASPFEPSPLEPREHAAIYRLLLDKLATPAFRGLAMQLSWLIIRGSYAERAVVFNVRSLSGPLVRRLKTLARALAEADPPVVSSHVYVDETESDYYLEARRPKGTLGFKTLAGPEFLRVAIGELGFSFHPTSFCQVNESIVPRMLSTAADLLEPRAGERLIDLYCGFGLFSLALADRVGDVVGVDFEGPSIESARANARRQGRRGTRFVSGRITAESLEKLPPVRGGEVVVLDPPRHGTETGVIEAVAERRPRRVLHVFCNVDEIPGALRQWTTAGYRLVRAVPLDMFPGTPNLEVLVALAPVGQVGD